MTYIRTPFVCILVALALLAPTAATAQISILDGEDSYLELGGYIQSVSGVQYLTYDTPDFVEDTTGINAEVLRLEWRGQLTDEVTFEVHNRFFGQISSADQGLGTGEVIGLGASRRPDRSLDLSSDLLDEEGLIINHDVDRAAVTIYTDTADVTVGRQAITWGRAVLFPVADLWTKFSPFELDQTQKRGTDAARVLAYPSMSTELDFVIADRGCLDDLSGGARASHAFDWGDGFVAAGKFWNEIIAMAGVSATTGNWRGRAELAEPYDLDDGELDLPRATLGADYIAADFQVSAEYHFNGAGQPDPDDYLAQLQSDVFERGESYYLGRHYVGGLVSYSGLERTQLALSAIANVGDPSVIVAPSFRYILSDEADINFGAFQGVGEDPVVELPPEVNSEYGLYGGFAYTQLRVFY
ncbi:MAG: hypothetical protein ACLFVJ_16695 [Persicimonas sp.]